MFTGIVQGFAPVIAVDDVTSLRRLTVDMADQVAGLQDGASVSVNGVCLTVVRSSETDASLPQGHVAFDVIAESLQRTNLGGLTAGERVNVERSYRVGDEVGGHILSGHVAAAIEVVRIDESDNLRNLFVHVPDAWMKYLPLKGFVALDGASLTISSVDAPTNTIGVSLIPETIERTSLGRVTVGDRLNLEVDAQTQSIVDTVERVLASQTAG